MKNIALISIYGTGGNELQMYARVLYKLLEERKPEVNISHEKMPSFQEHLDFIQTRPYSEWYLIQSLDERGYPFVGGIYLNQDNSIGIGILDNYKRQHYASTALEELIKANPRPKYYANINPANYQSKEFFKRHGFKFWRTLKGYRKDHDDRLVFTTVQEIFIREESKDTTIIET